MTPGPRTATTWSIALVALSGCITPQPLRIPTLDGTSAQKELTPGPYPADRCERLPSPATQPVLLASWDDSGAGAAEQLPEPKKTPDLVQLQDVEVSVQQSYPLIQVALADLDIADGKLLAAWGDFDLTARAYTLNEPIGYYENYRQLIQLEKPLWQGGYALGQYRIGDGDFAPWYGERETDEGGEFAVGMGVPLLQDRRIDKRRATVFRRGLARDAVDPAIRAQVLQFHRIAAQVYWSWVAAGQALQAQTELLDLSQERASQVKARVESGDLEEIALINNDQLIASREAKVIEADRKMQQSAIKLSLFLRTPNGEPIVPKANQAPRQFPRPSPPPSQQLETDIAAATSSRPELEELNLQRERARVELASAKNLILPKVDAVVLASQDVGGKATPKGDKQPLELQAGVYGEVRWQRREAQGKIQTAQAKLSQLTAKQQFVADKIVTDVQDAYSGMLAAAARIARAEKNLTLARRTSQLGTVAFNAGDIDLVVLNIYEQAVTDAELQLIAAQEAYFRAHADYLAALGIDPSKRLGADDKEPARVEPRTLVVDPAANGVGS